MSMNQESRLLEAINSLRLAGRGTLWIIKDKVWEKTIEDYDAKRIGHPGLAISRKKYKSLFDTVPMMIGTGHYSRGGFWVEGVVPYLKKKNKLTFFNVVRPRLIPEDEAQPLAIQGFMGNNDEIKRNTAKSKLNQEEMERLETYLDNKGIDA